MWQKRNVTMEIPWSDYLLTGNEVVDIQHKKLFDYLQILIATSKSGIHKSVQVKNSFDALIEYTITHFEDEEIILEGIEYPELANHQKMHRNFTKDIIEFRELLEIDEIIIDKLILFIQNWFVLHIKQEDMKAMRFRRSD